MQCTCHPQLLTSLLLGPPTLALKAVVQLSRRHDCVEYRAFRRFGCVAIESGERRSVPKRPIGFVTACKLTGSADTPSRT